MTTPKLSIQCTTEPFEQYMHNGGGIDFRLDEERWEILNIGDEIEYWEDFSGWDKEPQPNARRLLCVAEDFIRVANFEELINVGQAQGFFENEEPDEIINNLRQWWSPEQENKTGVLGIKHRVIG
jgi:ASC-1-like (ASCH) protein